MVTSFPAPERAGSVRASGWFGRIATLALAAVLGLAAAPAAQASFIEFTDWKSSNTPANLIPTFRVDQLTNDDFKVTIDISSVSPNGGFLTGVYFDLGEGLLKSDITPLEPAGWSVDKFQTNVTFPPFTQGANSEPRFQYFFDFKYNENPKDQLPPPVTFTLSNTLGFLLEDWTRVGLRFQTVGPNGDLSERTMSATVIPLPAAGWLLIGGLAGLGALRRRSR